MTELKPCPFCHKTSYLKVEPFFEPSFEGYYGFTVVCSAAGFDNTERGCGAAGAWGETEEDAAAKWNTRPAAPVEGLIRYDISMFGNGIVEMGEGQYVRFDQAEAIIAALKKDRLPDGHTILEQADIHDGTGRISQTVRVEATGEEYERIVHADEAYGEDE